MGTLISMQEAKTAEMSFSDHLEINFKILKNSVQKKKKILRTHGNFENFAKIQAEPGP